MEAVLDPKKIDARLIETAAKTIREGGIIIFPTDTFYGIGADPFNKVTVSRIFALKQRVTIKPILLIIDEKDKVKELATDTPELFDKFAEKFWPGPLTISLKANDKVPSITTAYSNRIGMRIPNAPIPLAIAKAVGGPITATSANISGAGHIADPDKIKEMFGEKVDMILYAGKLKAKAPSTLIDVYEDEYKVIREGAISVDELKSVSAKIIS